MTPRTLSSVSTYFIKFVVPVLWIPVYGAVILFLGYRADLSRVPLHIQAIVILSWLVGVGLIVWIYAGLKRVRIDQDTLYVSNFFREITVPLSEIDSVAEKRWMRHHPVTIVFRHPTEFGDKITFLPIVRLRPFVWTPHPVVEQIELAAYMKRFPEREVEKRREQ